MGWMDRIFGRDDVASDTHEPQYRRTPASGRSDDDIAVGRYRYLLRTAPPEAIESVHAEAFARLTPRQRDLVFEELSANAPAGERPIGNDASALAHSATRSEFRQPGTVERALRASGSAPGIGSAVGGSMLGTVAGFVIGSAIVSSFLPSDGDLGSSVDDGPSRDHDGSDGMDSGFGDFGGFDL